MSFVAVVKGTNITNLDVLERAARALNCELVRDVKTFRAHEVGQACDHIIRLLDRRPGAYEVGIRERVDGTYELAFDSYLDGQGLVPVIGKKACNLVQQYAVADFLSIAELQGMTLTEQATDGQDILLTMEL